MRNRYIAFGIVFGLVTSGSFALAQMVGTGRTRGTIQEMEGEPIEGASITAVRQDGKVERTLETTSDSNGRWALLGFRTTIYEFNFTAEGFQSQVSVQNIVQMGRNPVMNVFLPRLQIREAAAGGGPSALDEANELFEQKQYAAAVAKYQELLAEEPTFHQLNYSIGVAYHQMGELDNAIAAYDKMLAEEPMHTNSLLNIGDIMVAKDDMETAVGFFEKAIDQSQDETIPFNVAEFYFNRGESAKAIEYYQKAAERKPDWPEPHLKIGYAQLNAGNMDAAIAAFEKAVELAPDSPQAQMAETALSSLKK
jgi:Flp pilus assembly protein TadD